MNTTYILQKDLSDSKAGDEYIFNETYERYYKSGNVQDSYWTKDSVEGNPEWFKEKRPVLTVSFMVAKLSEHLNKFGDSPVFFTEIFKESPYVKELNLKYFGRQEVCFGKISSPIPFCFNLDLVPEEKYSNI